MGEYEIFDEDNVIFPEVSKSILLLLLHQDSFQDLPPGFEKVLPSETVAQLKQIHKSTTMTNMVSAFFETN